METAPDWFQLLRLCCLDSGTFHSLGEEKAQGSEGCSPRLSRSVASMFQGAGSPGLDEGVWPSWERLRDFLWSLGHLGS